MYRTILCCAFFVISKKEKKKRDKDRKWKKYEQGKGEKKQRAQSFFYI